MGRTTLYQLLSEERPMTSGIAARLSLALGNTACFWLNLQANYDAWHAERDSRKQG
jgi:antitoxin HigA-1